jgi:hypothetical protein
MAVELVHVVDLWVVCTKRFNLPNLSTLCRAWLEQLVRLSTTAKSLLYTTPFACLTSLHMASYHAHLKDDWLDSLHRLSSLKHIYIEHSTNPNELGQVLACLADSHRTLRSIKFPSNEEAASSVLRGLLDISKTKHLASIRTLVNGPRCMNLIRLALEHLPGLVSYANTAVCDDSELPAGLVSLSLNECNVNRHAWLSPYLANLTSLSVDLPGYTIMGSFPRLQQLQLSTLTSSCYKKVISMAPHLEHLIMTFPSIIWRQRDPRRYRPPYFADLARALHLRHVELLAGHGPCCVRITPDVVTSALLTAMMASPKWRQVTCYMAPVSLFLTGMNDAQVASLAHVQWHVVQHQKLLGTYRPLIEIVSWRKWIPGLNARKLIWDFCLRM